MTRKKAKSRFKFTVKYSPIVMTQTEWQAAEDLLAVLVARAIAAEHPEWFGRDTQKSRGGE